VVLTDRLHILPHVVEPTGWHIDWHPHRVVVVIVVVV
jgi:hypothetical protein